MDLIIGGHVSSKSASIQIVGEVENGILIKKRNYFAEKKLKALNL